MKIISSFKDDTSSEKPAAGSYEWWYFDAISDDKSLSFVIIFYEGNPFSERYIDAQKAERNGVLNRAESYPALSISVYKYGKPVYYGFEEFKKGDADYRVNEVYGKAGKSFFSGKKTQNKMIYHLDLNQLLPGGDSIVAQLTFSSDYAFADFPADDQSDSKRHTWNLVQPVAEVEGKIEISSESTKKVNFRGSGYHDHNLGMEPMKNSFENWYWGRFHFHNFTLVYYIMNMQNSVLKKAWIINEYSKITSLQDEINLIDFGYNVFGLKSARQIEIKGERKEIYIQQAGIVDNGPFYQRFLSRAVMHNDEDITQAHGITEYIEPKRIYRKIFRPLVNMRISYPDKSNWVQNSPVLYRWTW
jgi:carotenoid 1,2-hydratase